MPITLSRLRRILYREYKEICHQIFEKNISKKTIIFIVGCQRSGTTMLSQIFEKDYRTKVYNEVHSKVSSQDSNGLRLNPLPILKEQINNNNAGIIIAKPLVESQHTDKLLNDFPNGKAIWLFRHYKDVTSSDLKKFGYENGIKNLRKILFEKEYTWRSENISKQTLALVNKYFKESMSQNDAGALFWYTRNILFFDQNLAENDRVLICKYEDLVSEPQKTMNNLYQYINLSYPKKKITSSVHSSSIKKGKNLTIHPEIELLCQELYLKLNGCYDSQTN